MVRSDLLGGKRVEMNDVYGFELFPLYLLLGIMHVSGIFVGDVDLLFLDFQSCLPKLNMARKRVDSSRTTSC